jgi:hypothetical protein
MKPEPIDIPETKSVPSKIEMRRECGDCSMCCEGHLNAVIHGIPMSKGRPCHFLGKCDGGGCTIYEDRPPLCEAYQCLWKYTPTLPEWMKPNLSDVIMAYHEEEMNGEQVEYLTLREGNNTIRSDVLNYVLRLCLEHNKNLEYECNGSWYHLGDHEWIRFHVEKGGGEVHDGVTIPELAQTP